MGFGEKRRTVFIYLCVADDSEPNSLTFVRL